MRSNVDIDTILQNLTWKRTCLWGCYEQ